MNKFLIPQESMTDTNFSMKYIELDDKISFGWKQNKVNVNNFNENYQMITEETIGIQNFRIYRIESRMGLEQKTQEISKLLFKGSLRNRYQPLRNIQNIPEMLENKMLEDICKTFDNLDEILKDGPLTFQEIIIKFMSEFQIEFSVHELKRIIFVWPTAYDLQWNCQQNLRQYLKIQIKETIQNRRHIFQQKLFEFIQRDGCIIPFGNFPVVNPNVQNYLVIDQDQFRDIKIIAIELQSYYKLRNLSNMYFQNVEKHLIKKQIPLNELSKINEFIDQLCKLFPNWIQILLAPSGKIITINTSLEIIELIMEAECLDML